MSILQKILEPIIITHTLSDMNSVSVIYTFWLRRLESDVDSGKNQGPSLHAILYNI
jgi:hypothetical protein